MGAALHRPKYTSMPVRKDTKDRLLSLRQGGETMDDLLNRLATAEHVRTQQQRLHRNRLYGVSISHPDQPENIQHSCWSCFETMYNGEIIRTLLAGKSAMNASGWIFERQPAANFAATIICDTCRKLLINQKPRSHHGAKKEPEA